MNYGIDIQSSRGSKSRYRADGEERWDLGEAAEIAAGLLETRSATYVTVGDGEHEFRLCRVDVERWAEWFVDAEMVGRRWRYRPLADLGDYGDADNLAEEAAELHPDVTRVWIGRSDGSEEQESETGPS